MVIPYTCSTYGSEAVSDIIKDTSIEDMTMNNKSLKLLIVPNKYKMIARKGIESNNSKYKLSLEDIKTKGTSKAVSYALPISNSDQYDIAVQFEQIPLTLAKASKINKNLKAYEKPLKEQKALSQNIIKLLGGKK